MNGLDASKHPKPSFSEIIDGLNIIKSDVFKIRSDVKILQEGTLTGALASIKSEVNHNEEGMNGMKPIGFLKSVYKELNGIPRQPGLCRQATATLTIDKEVFNNPEHSLQDIEQFSHIWLIFLFHLNKNVSTKAKVKPPRMNGAKTGVFSTRSPYRPNPIGLSLVNLIDVKGCTLYFSGIDIVDGTPVLDIKPYIPYSDNPILRNNDEDESEVLEDCLEKCNSPAETSVATWLDKSSVGNLTVRYTSSAEADLSNFSHDSQEEKYKLNFYKNSCEVKSAITHILKNDPRSAYRRKKCTDRLYYLNVDVAHVTCWFDDENNVVEVVAVKPHMLDK